MPRLHHPVFHVILVLIQLLAPRHARLAVPDLGHHSHRQYVRLAMQALGHHPMLLLLSRLVSFAMRVHGLGPARRVVIAATLALTLLVWVLPLRCHVCHAGQQRSRSSGQLLAQTVLQVLGQRLRLRHLAILVQQARTQVRVKVDVPHATLGATQVPHHRVVWSAQLVHGRLFPQHLPV